MIISDIFCVQCAMATTSDDSAYWMLGEPDSLKFWSDSAQTDQDERSIAACPDMSGNMLPTQAQALRHITYIKQDYADILTTDSEERKKLVLAVQAHRRMYKYMNKVDLVKRIDEEGVPTMEDFEEMSDVTDDDEGVLMGKFN